MYLIIDRVPSREFFSPPLSSSLSSLWWKFCEWKIQWEFSWNCEITTRRGRGGFIYVSLSVSVSILYLYIFNYRSSSVERIFLSSSFFFSFFFGKFCEWKIQLEFGWNIFRRERNGFNLKRKRRRIVGFIYIRVSLFLSLSRPPPLSPLSPLSLFPLENSVTRKFSGKFSWNYEIFNINLILI